MTEAAPLGDEVLVVRGGIVRTVPEIVEQVIEAFEDDGRAVLSVWAADVRGAETQEEALVRACRDGNVRNGKIQIARLGDLRAGGFTVVQEGEDDPDHHHHVYFDVESVDAQAASWLACFAEPTINQGKPPRRLR